MNISLVEGEVVDVTVSDDDGRSYELGLSAVGGQLLVVQDGSKRGKLSLLDEPVYELKLAVMGGSLIVLQSGALRGTLSLQDAPVPEPAPVLVASDSAP